MAEIWLFSGASEPVEEEEVDERPFGECVELLELSEDRYMGQDPTKAPADIPKFTNGDRYLVVAVNEEEAGATGWKPAITPLYLSLPRRWSGLASSSILTTIRRTTARRATRSPSLC
jgi:hypothetical protein